MSSRAVFEASVERNGLVPKLRFVVLLDLVQKGSGILECRLMERAFPKGRNLEGGRAMRNFSILEDLSEGLSD